VLAQALLRTNLREVYKINRRFSPKEGTLGLVSKKYIFL
jgi:hypothetical protein